jgi:damage-control phosphatase, subfamily III
MSEEGPAAAGAAAVGDPAAHAARVAALCALPFPPHAPLTASEDGSFAQDTVTRRLPLIIEGVMADLRLELEARQLAAGSQQQAPAAAAAHAALAKLRDDMASGAPLAPTHHPLRTPGEAAVPPTARAAVGAAAPSSVDDDARFAVACRADAAARGLAGCRGSPREALAYCLAWTNAGIDAAARVARPSSSSASPPTWLDMPWLAVECYLYARLLAGCLWSDEAAAAGLATAAAAAAAAAAAGGDGGGIRPAPTPTPTPQQPYYDPFARQKAAALIGSSPAAEEIGRATLDLLARVEASAASRGGAPPQAGDAQARAALHSLCQYALWGNKTDLSLSAGSAAALSKGGSAVLEAAAEAAGTTSTSTTTSPLLCDDFDALWRALAAPPPSPRPAAATTVHLVLDNAALELFTDLCLADGLLSSGCASVVVLHGKPLPWFVSDALAVGDLGALLWPSSPPPSSSSPSAARALAERWRAHAQAGRLLWAEHPFWTTPLPFWWMGAAAPALEAALFGGGGGGGGSAVAAPLGAGAVPLSSLPPSRAVIFKGDLNYRKLTADVRWPWTTPFAEALGPLGGGGGGGGGAAAATDATGVALVTLRTLKADVVAGLGAGVGEAAAARDKDWLVTGRFGVVQAATVGVRR